MADITEKAEDEARKKGLDEQETEQYVGGVYNAIRKKRHSYASPHAKRVSRKEEKEEESRHWKKYHRLDDREMMYKIRDTHQSLTMKGRSTALAHFKREGWTTDYRKMDRRQMEKMLDYEESLAEKPGMKRYEGYADDVYSQASS